MTTPAYSPFSRNPADNDTLAGLFRLVLTKFLQNMDDMLPAQVVSYNPATNMAAVQPLITVTTTANQSIPRPQYASIPVFQPSGGGFVTRYPISAGDYGWIKSNDRDISLFMATFATSAPNTARKHSFEDGVFIPQAAWNAIELAEEDYNNFVIQNYAGTVKIAMWENLIKILAPEGVGIGGTPHITGILDLQSTTQAFILPRMTTPQKMAISEPIEGMIVWDLTENGISTYNGTSWS